MLVLAEHYSAGVGSFGSVPSLLCYERFRRRFCSIAADGR